MFKAFFTTLNRINWLFSSVSENTRMPADMQVWYVSLS